MSDLRARLARLSPEQRAALEERMRRQPSPQRAPGIPRRAGNGPAPLSFGQERLWFLQQLDPADASYNMFMVQRLRGRVSTEALRHALGRLVERHATLRARFTAREGSPVQEIGPPEPVEPDLIDLTGLPADERESRATELVADLTNRPFDLAAGPLLRVHLITLSRNDHVLCVVLHHIVADGWSLKILLGEFATLYGAHLEGREAVLPEPVLEYADYAAWQRERLDEEGVRRQLDYWGERLAGVPVLDVPADRPRSPVRSSNGDYAARRIGRELTAHLDRLARDERCTPFMVLLAAFQTLLGAHSGQDDVCVGSVIAGRERPELEHVVGFFPNTLALRADLSGDPGFRELLGRVRSTVLDAFAHQDIPFERLLNELHVERDLSTTPLFQAMFVMQDKDASALTIPGLETGVFDPGARQAKFDLMLDVTPRSDSLYALLSYNADLFEPDTMARMLRRYERVLEAVAADPDIPLSRLRAAMLLPEDRLPAVTASLSTGARPSALLSPGDVSSAGALPGGVLPDGVLPDGVLPGASGAGVAGPAARPSGGTAGVVELFEERVRLAPDAPAVGQGDRRLSYAELDERAGRLAARLAAAGAGPETVVAVRARRGLELVVALIAVLKAGAAYLPLDPAYPAERLRWMLRDSGAALLLSQDEPSGSSPRDGVSGISVTSGVSVTSGASVTSGVSEGSGASGSSGVSGGEVPVIPLEGVADGPPTGDAVTAGGGRVPVRGGAANLAYVIYTSGSTGRPKGVQVERRALDARVAWMRAEYGVGPGDRVLQFASVGFDTHAEEVYPALTSGAELVLAPDEPLPDFLRTPEAASLTVMDLPTSYWQELVAARITWPAALRLLILGADPLHAPALASWYEAQGERVTLVNSYGPTETTIIATAGELDPAEASRRPTVGHPLSGTRVHVLDAYGARVPVGVPGELCIGGDGLARGYLGSPALTAERFVPDPHGPAGARLYRTGDRARFRPDGRLEILGRLDRQVKIRGYRVEPGEIEARLLAHPRVARATVTVREDTPGDRRLVAYVVPRDPGTTGPLPDGSAPGEVVAEGRETGASTGARPGDVDLRGHLAAELPPHLVPSAVVEVARIPLTPSGKVDQAALPAPEHRSGEGYLPPGTPTQELVCSVWAEVLGVDRVGALDDFFQLGGHSLLATRTIARLSAATGLDVPLKLAFSHSSVRRLAEALDELAQAGPGTGAGPGPVRRPEGTAPPLSFAQERLWFMEQFSPGTGAYVLPAAARLRGPLDLAALAARLDAAVARHESLRMRFPAAPDGRPEVRIVAADDPASRVALRVVDAGPGAGTKAEAGTGAGTGTKAEAEAGTEAETRARAAEVEARRIVSADAARPFDLAGAPPLRATLVRIGPGDHVLLVAVHHIVADGWSAELLLDELLTDRAGRAEPSVGYGDYALWQRDRLTGERLEGHLEFWRRELAALPPLELPLDRPRPARQGHRGAWHDLRLDAGLTGDLGELGRENGATLYMVLLAAYQAVLSRWSGQRDFAVGSPVAGRDRAEFEDVVGLFVNLLPLRARLEGDPTFTDLLGRTRDAALEVYAHQELPFEKLVAELDLARDATRPPVVQALFALQSYLGGTVPAGSVVAPAGGPGHATTGEAGSRTTGGAGTGTAATTVTEPFAPDTTSTRFDLELYVSETGGGLAARFVYNRDLFLPATVERMAASFETFLRSAVAAPRARVGELDLLSPAERELVLTGWNATGTAYPPPETLHGLVEEQVARTPDAPAVIFGDDTLTYAELNDRAEALAARLRAGGGEVFAVRAERSLDLPVRLLAVLKAGAAYLPLDPGLPDRRVAAMLADAGAVELDTLADPGETGHRVGERPDSLAYVIFTSGSTGRPKGVGVSHRAIVNRLRWMQETYRLDAGDAVLQKTPAGFDVSVWEFFWPLISGARLVLARPDGQRDTAYLRDLVIARAITTMHFVPSMLAAFTAEERIEECRSLRRVICSGEELTAAAAERLTERLPGVELHNLYGPTEAAVDVSWHRYVPGEPTVPIGRPVANTRLYVLDGSLRPVPAGMPGELFIGGVQVARGYLGRPALTAERFLPDPYGPPGSRLYATGDRARRRPDGELDYLGRLDTQTKIRGMRVEPGEIEAALARHPELGAAAVGVTLDGPGGARLVGYVVRRPGAGTLPGDAPGEGGRVREPARDPEPHDRHGVQGPAGDLEPHDRRGVRELAADPELHDRLRDRLREELPEHMVPALWVELEALPLTPNGKLDRAALPSPSPSAHSGVAAWEPPRPGAEQDVAEVWRDVLGLERVGRHDGFFSVGGDSILSLSVVAGLRRRGYTLDLQRLFTHQTVAELASVLDTPGAKPVAEPEPKAATGAFGLLSAADLAKLRKGER
ncbi:amino acid adenylation domain-containing protein [Streptosporangium sp. DT93]|uniref:amino acid adenylation domain-containing protein n=1 Tax=Streptosporangium sp. DT93 TaxID=3393428 RepID=UPI003CE889DE